MLTRAFFSFYNEIVDKEKFFKGVYYSTFFWMKNRQTSEGWTEQRKEFESNIPYIACTNKKSLIVIEYGKSTWIYWNGHRIWGKYINKL